MERVRHLIPVWGDKQLISLGGESGGRSSSAVGIEDVLLHAKLLAGTLGVDLSMLGFADQLSGGLGEGGFFRTSAQAAERSRIIRVAAEDFFNHVIDVHTSKRYGFVFSAGERPWDVQFYGSISALEAERTRTRTESMNAGMLLAQAMQTMKDMGASEEIMRAFLNKTMMLDDEEATLYAGIVNAKPPVDEGGGFGGGAV